MAKKLSKKTKRIIINYTMIVFGCLISGFGAAVFLTPCNIVSGGITSIGIIVNHYLEPVVGFDTNSLVSVILQVLFLILGFIVLGKSFSFKTIVASILFVGFYSLFMTINTGSLLGLDNAYQIANNADITDSAGILLLMGVAGGALQGIGVAITYLAGGSTGGTDIPARIIAKFTHSKESGPLFLIDCVLVVAGMLVFRNFLLGLIGVLTAFVIAAALEVIYGSLNAYLVFDIISDKYLEIQEYVHSRMENDGHASTLIHAQGGYSKVEKEMLRVVVFKREEATFRSVIYSIDPTAFIVVSQAKSTHGDGFDPLQAEVAYKIKKTKKDDK